MDDDKDDGRAGGSGADAAQVRQRDGRDAGRGDSLKDASDEAVVEIEERRDGVGHAGAGDIG